MVGRRLTLSRRYYKSRNENLTIRGAQGAMRCGVAATSPPRCTENEFRRATTSHLIPLFTFAFRTRAGIQLRHAVLQDTLPGQ